jgi:hypothetical protein
MIPQVTIQEAQEIAPWRGIHNLINLGQAERIFLVGPVEIGIINTHPPIFILLGVQVLDGLANPGDTLL